jgi:hypothetical protein
MKQAKFALTAVALLAVIGGALAFKANRVQKSFYGYTTTLTGGAVTGACLVEQKLFATPTLVGGNFTTISDQTAIRVTTCTTKIVPNN